MQKNNAFFEWLSLLERKGILEERDSTAKKPSRLNVSFQQLGSFLESASQNRTNCHAEFFEDLFLLNEGPQLVLHLLWVDRQSQGESLQVRVVLDQISGDEVVSLPSVANYWPSARGAEMEAEVLYGVKFTPEKKHGSTFSIGEAVGSSRFPLRSLTTGGRHA